MQTNFLEIPYILDSTVETLGFELRFGWSEVIRENVHDFAT